MVHRRPEWYAAVRMNSVRVRPIEDDTNWDNALGRYFSDGVCLVMRSGREYEDITACWDWTRLPGTTLPKTPVYTPEESARRRRPFPAAKPRRAGPTASSSAGSVKPISSAVQPTVRTASPYSP